ncbi:MAG TPA: lytic transglycosylase domain-containing protein [Chitinophagaceae bacterium]|nr:lytic transglycosylase domain-containing protein [Chitinophagaceae bacterium]
MPKQIIGIVLSFFLLSFTDADFGKDSPISGQPQFSDTTDLKSDSLKQQTAEQENSDKKDFRELAKETRTTLNNSFQQLNPRAISFVEDYQEKYGDKTSKIKDWGRPYFNIIDAILIQHNLPKELKYLAVVESNLKSNAYSWAGAAGPWQLMPATARNMGLKVTKSYDERRDYYKSTHAACKYLKSLFKLYGDWLLVIAAYNSGPGGVNSAIKKSGSRDFWVLQRYLPAQSQGHVKKFVAIHYILEGQGSIVTATKDEAINIAASLELTPEETAGSKTQTISGRYNSVVIVKHLTMDIAAFNKLNPDFDKLIASNGNYELRLPDDKMQLFMAKKPEILSESMQLLLSPVSNSNETSGL